jgi:chemotaxis protein MotB
LRATGRYAQWYLEPPAADAEGEGEGWLLTYLDMITLLLVMMVVLLAFSEPLRERQSVLAGVVGLQGSPSPLQGQGSAAIAPPAVVPPETPPREGPELVDKTPDRPPADPSLADALTGLPLDGLGNQIELVVNEGTVSFRISSELLFASGDASLVAGAEPVLQRLVDVLKASPYPVSIEGHTDNVPIQTERFPSNWELSGARAGSVVRYLQARGIDPARMRAVGHADTRPLTDNATPQSRARNRRVEVILETPKPGAAAAAVPKPAQ